jgi:D-alanine-D-alanine ligase
VKVALVVGGASSEHSISLLSGFSVASALTAAGHQVELVGITPKGHWTLLDSIPRQEADRLPVLAEVPNHDFGLSFGECVNALRAADVTFPVLHGPNGEDGTVQGLFDLLGVAYVGSGVLSSAACIDKPTTKARLVAAGLPTPRFAFIDSSLDADQKLQAALQVIEGAQLRYPLFVKPARCGSSLGMTLIQDVESLAPAIAAATKQDQRVIFEEAVTGMQEVECGVLVKPNQAIPIASTPSEIRVKLPHTFYDFEAKYLDDSADLLVPAEITPAMSAKVQAMAIKVFEVMGCASLARVDFFVRGDEVLVSEVNTMPGFTDISMYPRMFVATGISYQQLVDDLVTEAKSRFNR